MKMRLKMKNRSHRYDINRPRPNNSFYLQHANADEVIKVIKSLKND